MARSAISPNDLLEGVRQAAGARSLDEVDEVYIDSSGEISVVTRRGDESQRVRANRSARSAVTGSAEVAP